MQKKRKKPKKIPRITKVSGGIILSLALILAPQAIANESAFTVFNHTKSVQMPTIQEELLTPNAYSRSQKELTKVNGIVIHYVANPGSSAIANRNYFEGLATSHTTYASSHFVVDLDGSIIQCIPLDEIAYASNGRNDDTISIEVCHPDDTGKFSVKTYNSLVKLVAWLCGEYNLKQDDIIRHYDVTGKNCPKYYVENEDAWVEFKEDVFDYIGKNE